MQKMECVELGCEVDCMYVYMSLSAPYHLEKRFLAHFLNVLYTVYTLTKSSNK